MLEEMFTCDVFGYDHECVNVRSCWSSVCEKNKDSQGYVLTRPIDTKSVAPKCKDLAARGIDGRLRKIFTSADMLDKFHDDLLNQL